MARRTIIDYLIEGKKRGFSDEVLKDDLLDNGFDEKIIDDAFYQLKYQMKLQKQGSSQGASSRWGEEFDGSGKMPRQPAREEKRIKGKSSRLGNSESKSSLFISRGVSVLYFLASAVLIYFFINSLSSNSGGLASLLSSIPVLGSLSTAITVASSLFSLLILSVFVSAGFGVWKRKEWSRNLVIFLSLLFSVFGLLFILGSGYVLGSVVLLFNLFIGGYFWVNEDLMGYFGSDGFTGVKQISCSNFLGSLVFGIFGLFLAVLFLGFGDQFISVAQSFVQNIVTYGVIAIVFFVFMSVLHFFVGRGVWKGQNWAKGTTIVLSFLYLVVGSAGLIFGLLEPSLILVILNVLVLIYLFSSDRVNIYFS